mmetsp:Transcript_54362/g.145135  ORF Transcript_54362/g.145135 Transcript_54362/m.145135 type:complete len:244 (+) Transcript_54362:345-1076(+)
MSPPSLLPKHVTTLARSRRSYTARASINSKIPASVIWVAIFASVWNLLAKSVVSGNFPRVRIDISWELPIGPREINAAPTTNNITLTHDINMHKNTMPTTVNVFSLLLPATWGTNKAATKRTRIKNMLIMASSRFTSGVFQGHTDNCIAKPTIKTNVIASSCPAVLSVKATAGIDSNGPRATSTKPYHHTSTRKRNSKNLVACKNSTFPLAAFVGATTTTRSSNATNATPIPSKITPTATITE